MKSNKRDHQPTCIIINSSSRLFCVRIFFVRFPILHQNVCDLHIQMSISGRGSLKGFSRPLCSMLHHQYNRESVECSGFSATDLCNKFVEENFFWPGWEQESCMCAYFASRLILNSTWNFHNLFPRRYANAVLAPNRNLSVDLSLLQEALASWFFK